MSRYVLGILFFAVSVFGLFFLFFSYVGAASISSTVVVSFSPNAPTGLTATSVSTSQVTLTWTDNANNEDGYQVERKTGFLGTYAQIATTSANIASFVDNTVSESTLYYYRVRGFNSDGESAYSNEASVTTASSVSPTPSPSPSTNPASGGGGGGTGLSIIYSATGTPLTLVTPPKTKCTPDLNRDGSINLIDLSILLYYFDRSGPSISCYDFNNNNTVDFADVSIMMYYWTG